VDAPAAGSGDWLLRLQLVGYAGLTGAFDRHDTLLAGGRELAVVASAALVAALLVFALTRRMRPITVALPLLAVLAMGPAVIVLATVGNGLVGTAWAAVGALVLASARRPRAAVPGMIAIAVGVATEPLVAVPLAVGIGVLLSRDGRWSGRSARDAVEPRHARPDTRSDDHRAWLVVLLVAPVAGLVATVPSGPDDLPLVAAERAVFLLLIALVTGVGLLFRDLRLPAAAAGSAIVLAVLPWRGAGAALPLALAAVALLAALMIAAWTSGPVGTRPHPLLRAAIVLPVLVLVVTGALFLPSAGRTPPHEQLAAWISGPSSSGGTVAVPTGLWGDLLRDGVPADRLVRVGSGSPREADWAVTVGVLPAGTPAVATFGGGPAGLTVLPGAGTEMQEAASEDEP
jgi:putative peptide zinc metalloprotease protein